MLGDSCLSWSQIDEWARSKGVVVAEEDRNQLTKQFLSRLVLEDLDAEKERIAHDEYIRSIKVQAENQHRMLVEAMKRKFGGVVPEIPEGLRRSAKMVIALGLDTLDPVLLTAAYDELEESVKEKAAAVEDRKYRLKDLESELQTLEVKRAALKEFGKKIGETKEQRDRENQIVESNLLVLRSKKIEYEQRLRDASTQNHVSVHQVDALRKQFEDLHKERNQLKAQLDAFNGLPADRTLARIKVAEAEHELQMLIDQRNKLLRARGH